MSPVLSYESFTIEPIEANFTWSFVLGGLCVGVLLAAAVWKFLGLEVRSNIIWVHEFVGPGLLAIAGLLIGIAALSVSGSTSQAHEDALRNAKIAELEKLGYSDITVNDNGGRVVWMTPIGDGNYLVFDLEEPKPNTFIVVPR